MRVRGWVTSFAKPVARFHIRVHGLALFVHLHGPAPLFLFSERFRFFRERQFLLGAMRKRKCTASSASWESALRKTIRKLYKKGQKHCKIRQDAFEHRTNHFEKLFYTPGTNMSPRTTVQNIRRRIVRETQLHTVFFANPDAWREESSTRIGEAKPRNSPVDLSPSTCSC